MIELFLYFGVFVGIGAMLYILDERYGVERYQAWWNFTHKERLPKGNSLGFICGHRTRERIPPAVFAAVIGCLLLRLLGEYDFVSLILKGSLLMFPGLLLGFALAGLARKKTTLNPKVEAVLDAIDKVESGEVDFGDVGHTLAESARNLQGKAADEVHGLVDSITGNKPKPAVLPKTEEPVTPPPPKKSFKDALGEFKRKA